MRWKNEKQIRLIDADQLRKEVLDLPNCYNGYSDAYDKAYIIDLIDEQPTVEPQIIRCKDCEYGEQDEVGRWFCRSFGCQIGNEDGSGYCADAERKSE